jgi:hypothetical protein
LIPTHHVNALASNDATTAEKEGKLINDKVGVIELFSVTSKFFLGKYRFLIGKT